MTARQIAADREIQQHFNRSTELYVDQHEASYRIVCQQRIAMLLGEWRNREKEPLSILDVGCGAGVFCDHLLETFPNATVHCVDASIGMLMRGRSDRRKRLLLGDARALPFPRAPRFDLINVDALMHHLVSIEGYDATVSGITQFLIQLRQVLKPGGALLIREIYHEHRIHHELGARLVYVASSTKFPAPVAGLMKKAGLATANVGVSFLGRKRWNQVLRQAGFSQFSQQDKPWGRWTMSYLGFISGDIFIIAKTGGGGTSA